MHCCTRLAELASGCAFVALVLPRWHVGAVQAVCLSHDVLLPVAAQTAAVANVRLHSFSPRCCCCWCGQAEKLNGRACMVGYFMALVVDQLTGYGLVDQQNSFLGKLLLHITVFAVLLVRSTADLDKYKNLLDEATFYGETPCYLCCVSSE
jgi:cyanate permease